MSGIEKAFDSFFGTSDIPHPRKNNPKLNRMTHNRIPSSVGRDMTNEQKKFCSFLSLDTYKDEHGNIRRELIALLIQKNGQIKVEELRRPDFSKIERYRQPCVEQPICGIFPILGNWERMQGYDGDGYYRFFWRFDNRSNAKECDVYCDMRRPIQKLQARDIIDCLYKAAMDMKAGTAEQLSKLHDTLDKQLQEAGEDVFIYELLQNANDYPNGNEDVDAEFRLLRFRDGGGCLLFCHTGAEFSEKNVAALCSANDQDKSDNLSAIGYKGIGFKTVFRYNNRAEVRSGRFGFAFDKKIQEKKDGIPWRTTPSWVFPKVWDGYRVEIRLFPTDAKKLSDDDGSYSQQLRALFSDERPLLFIPCVRSVKLFLEDWDKPIVRCKDNDKWCMSGQLLVNVDAEIRKSIDDALKDVDHCRIPPKYRHLERTAVSFACRREGKRLLPEDNANLYCYLPAKDAQWGFRFLMNTDMIPNGPRNDIEYSLEVNKYFARVAGEKFFEWIDSLIRSEEYDYDSIFELMPDFDECKKNRSSKVVEFIQEFQDGFESRLTELQIPSSKGGLTPASSIVYDTTGILKELGESVWERLGCSGAIAHKSLRNSKDFDSFVKRYKSLIGIQEFSFDDLVNAVANKAFQEWLVNPMANQQFFKYLYGKGKLELFKSAKVFLDDKGKLGTPQEMYFHTDVEKYLKPFADCFRYLPSTAPCRDKLSGEWFLQLDPKKLVCEILFSSANEEQSRAKLGNVNDAKGFWCFLSRNKTYKYERQERYYSTYYSKWRYRQVAIECESFSKDFLGKLPVIIDGDRLALAITVAGYSIFIRMQDDLLPPVSGLKWIASDWVCFLSAEYFDCDEGDKVKEFLLERKLIRQWNMEGVLAAIVNKFKEKILQRMLDSGSDLDFYDFIFKCLGEKCVTQAWVKQEISDWPVQDIKGRLVERSGKIVFYSNDEILRWIKDGWLDGAILVLNEKYSTQKELFDLLGAEEYVADDFGEVFRVSLAPHLKLDSREKVIAFHRFMATKTNLLNANQVAELRKVPILVKGDENPVVGFDGVYLPTRIDISGEIATGFISAEIKVLDDELCNDSTIEYWKWLGVKSLDEVEILKKRLEKYLERQNQFLESGGGDADFKEHHKIFIGVLASRDALQTLKDGGSSDALKKVGLFAKDGKLRLPAEMRFSNEYMPLCDFESFDKNGAYVEEMYCGIEGIKELFKELGVKDRFSKDDVALLASTEFCKYFWTKYLNNNPSEWDEIKDCLKENLPCVLDRTGAVRKPEELYHLDIENYVLKLSDSEARLPMVDGIGKDCLSELEMRTSLSVEDSLAFLLADSECKMYKMRGRVLQWIADGCSKVSHDLAEKYRNDELAKWRNRQKEVVSVKELCAIRRDESSSRVRLFANNPHVMDLMGRSIGIPGEDAGTMWRNAEEALVWLGVKFVDHDSIIFTPDNKKLDDKVISAISVRMLVFLSERYPDAWEHEFDFVEQQLKNVKFYRCNKLLVQCRDIEWLRAEYGTFLPDNGIFYSVEDWLHPLVYCDVIARLGEDVFRKRYSIDDLKIALYAEGGDKQIAKRISSDTVGLLADEQFMKKLQKLFPDVHGMVCDMLRENESASNKTTGEENQSGAAEAAQPVNEEMGKDEISPPKPETKKNYSEEEESQMFRIFGNGLTVEQMNDENRLVCIRLFNSLKAEGYEPRMLEADFVRDVYNNKKTFRASTIETNDGRQIHVISARKGVAYLPPRWWTRLATPNNTKYVVCAVLNHLPEGFKYFRCRDDLLGAIGDNLGVIRVHGETAESRLERTLRLFKFDPELSDFSIYSLLRVKATCDYDAAFREDLKFADSIGREMGADEERDNDEY